MSFDLEALRVAVERYGIVARVVIAAHRGSTPRETGTAMLVWSGGQSGTIGGGALELSAVQKARAMLTPGSSWEERCPLGPRLGQCCGGDVTLVTEVFDAAHLPQNTGPLHVRRIASRDVQPPLALTQFIARHRSGATTDDLVYSGGWLAEPLRLPVTPVWVWGAGHVGRAIISTLAPLPGFALTWVDTSAERFPCDIPDYVDPLVAQSPAQVMPLAPTGTRHLILTYSHALDLELCHAALGTGFSSLGLIGSATKWARFRKRLGELGHAPAQIDRITCPIGNPALGKHPQAIAIGVAAQLCETALPHPQAVRA